jgi:N-acetylglucosamine malate deacetylase 1
MKVMVIEPGPNNGITGCGGSIVKHIASKNEVYMLSLTFGDAKTADFSPAEFRAIRKKETRAAADVLGIPQGNLIFLKHQVFSIPVEKATQEIMSVLREIKPDICYIPSPEGNHPDYPATFQAASRALSFSGGKWFKSAENCQDSWNVSTVLIYEVAVPLRSPSYYEAIFPEDMEKKKQALIAHSSQTASRRYDESSFFLNGFRGIMSGKGKLCEAFEVWRAEKVF